MDDFRQKVTDAALDELRRQLGDESVSSHGTSVEIDGSFRMVRVIDAIIRAAVSDHAAIVEEVARTLGGEDWEDRTDDAADAISAVRGRILEMLDPLP